MCGLTLLKYKINKSLFVFRWFKWMRKRPLWLQKNFFEDTRTTTYFLFETNSVSPKNGQWIVNCEVKSIFETKSKKFRITIDDESEAIMNVEILE